MDAKTIASGILQIMADSEDLRFSFKRSQLQTLCNAILALPGDAHQPGEPTDVVTLRDRFAMAALTGLCARSGSNLTPPERTWLAFEYADAAIEAREPKDGAQ